MNKELTALEEIKNGLFGHCRGSYLKDDPEELEKVLAVYENCFCIIETALKEGEKYKEYWNRTGYQVLEDDKKLKAFDIIKNKVSDVEAVRISNTLDYYNQKENGFVFLTEEEFKILKEALKND